MEHELAPLRRELLAGLHGRIVEVGAGNGLNFGHYPAEVGEVVAIEPEPYLRARARSAAEAAAVPVTLRDGLAEQLPAEPASFDAAVASLVLCSVGDPGRAVAELRRVLAPDGELRFFEHVRADGARKAAAQRLLDRTGVWPTVGGGCHCARDTVETLEAGGFRIDRLRRLELGPSWVLTNPFVIGTARLA